VTGMNDHNGHAPNGAAMAVQDPVQLASILSTVADLTVVLTPEGVICDKVMSGPDLPSTLFVGWPGKTLSDTVTIESRPKIQQLLQDASDGLPPRWRQVNHRIADKQDIPISYSALRAGPSGHIIAFGRDMSTTAQLQQRLIAAEQAVEQEYQRLRHSETRFRVLLQVASDGIIIVDARTGRIAEANPAASVILDRPIKRLTSANIDDVFSDTDRPIVKRTLENLRASGRADDVALRPGAGAQQAILSMSMFRQDSTSYVLMRIVPHIVGTSAVVLPKAQSKVVKIINEMPAGFVVTDMDRNILTANAAFLALAQLASEEQARGNPVDRWLGRPGVDFGMIAGQLEAKGEVRNFQTIMRGQFGAVEDVEVSGVAVNEGDMPCYGFTMNVLSRHRSAGGRQEQSLLRSVDDFTRLVGKVPLKDLVRESTDIIERLCIEAALELNGDNRASTAEMLGLSRQSLYVKLHRYGIDSPELKHALD
jgi:transcriptional regulator PpsR